MQEFEREEGSGFADDPGRAEWMADLTSAADRLRESIARLTQVMVRGSAIEKVEARDRFDIALAHYSALLEQTRE